MTLVNCTPGFSKTYNKNLWSPFNTEFFRTPGVFNTTPAVNIKETPSAFMLEVAAPGLNKEDFHVKVDEGLLTISSSKENKTEEAGSTWSRKEFNFASFERSFRLPETIASESITAKYENGVLFVEIPKREEAKEKPARDIVIG